MIVFIVGNNIARFAEDSADELLTSWFGTGSECCFMSSLKEKEEPQEPYRVVFRPSDFELVRDAYYYWSSNESFFVWLGERLLGVSGVALNDIKTAAATAPLYEKKAINKMMSELDRKERRSCLRSLPLSMQIETTDMCNARCIMCSHYYTGNQGCSTANPSIEEFVWPMLPFMEFAILHGNGEPFLRKDITEILGRYKANGVMVTTNTNLSYLSDSLAQLIEECFFELRVSCDACTQELYESIRIGLSFQGFLENANKLRTFAPSVRKVMVVVAMRQNLDQLPQIVDFAADLGFAEVSFQPLGVNLLIGNELDDLLLYPNYAAEQFESAQDIACNRGLTVEIPGFAKLWEIDSDQAEKERRATKRLPSLPTGEDAKAHQAEILRRAIEMGGENIRPVTPVNECSWEKSTYTCSGICEWSIERPYIDINGNVSVCCINQTYALGNINDCEDFEEIWNGPAYRAIRESFYRGELPEFCVGCQFLGAGNMRYLSVKGIDTGNWSRRHISSLYEDNVKWLRKTKRE